MKCRAVSHPLRRGLSSIQGGRAPCKSSRTKLLTSAGWLPMLGSHPGPDKIDSERRSRLCRALPFYSIRPSPTKRKDAVCTAIMPRARPRCAPAAFIAKAGSLVVPLKMLDRVLGRRGARDAAGILVKMDTEYERDPQRKLQILSELETRHGPAWCGLQHSARRARDGSLPPVGAVALQRTPPTVATRCSSVVREDSMRIKVRIIEGFGQRGWPVDQRALASCRAFVLAAQASLTPLSARS